MAGKNKNPNRPKGRGIFNVSDTPSDDGELIRNNPATASGGVSETNKIEMILVTREGCGHCSQTKEIIKKIKPEYPGLSVSEVDIITPKGQKLVGRYGIMSSPGIIINGQLFSMGGTTEKELRKKLDGLVSLLNINI